MHPYYRETVRPWMVVLAAEFAELLRGSDRLSVVREQVKIAIAAMRKQAESEGEGAMPNVDRWPDRPMRFGSFSFYRQGGTAIRQIPDSHSRNAVKSDIDASSRKREDDALQKDDILPQPIRTAPGWGSRFVETQPLYEYAPLLPLPDRRLSLSEAYLVLAVIHDRCGKGEKINPWQSEERDASERCVEEQIYQWQLEFDVRSVPDTDEHFLRLLLLDVNCDLQARESVAPGETSAGGKKRPGKKKADSATERREAGIVEQWEDAKGAGVYKPKFAKGIGMTVKELDRLLDRVRRRKRRSDN